MASQPQRKEIYSDWQLVSNEPALDIEDQMLVLLKVSPTHMQVQDLRLYLDFRQGFTERFGKEELFRLEAELLLIQDGPVHLVHALTSNSGAPENAEVAVAMARLNSARSKVQDRSHSLPSMPLNRTEFVRQILASWSEVAKAS